MKPKTLDDVIEEMTSRNKRRDFHNASFEQLCSVMELEMRCAAQVVIDAVMLKEEKKMSRKCRGKNLWLAGYKDGWNACRNSVIQAGKQFMGKKGA